MTGFIEIIEFNCYHCYYACLGCFLWIGLLVMKTNSRDIIMMICLKYHVVIVKTINVNAIIAVLQLYSSHLQHQYYLYLLYFITLRASCDSYWISRVTVVIILLVISSEALFELLSFFSKCLHFDSTQPSPYFFHEESGHSLFLLLPLNSLS